MYTGNLLGTIVADPIGGLENLIRLPRGCGEQTMLYLGPTLFVYKYLASVGEDTPALEGKVYDYLAAGKYQWIHVMYMHIYDGSSAISS